MRNIVKTRIFLVLCSPPLYPDRHTHTILPSGRGEIKSAWWVKNNSRRKKERRREKEPKYLLTMASYACECYHGWRMQTAWVLYIYIYILGEPFLKKSSQNFAMVIIMAEMLNMSIMAKMAIWPSDLQKSRVRGHI